MTTALLAQFGSYSLIHIIGIAFVIARAAGVSPPGWLIQVLWIVVAVVVGVVAIKFLAGLL